MFDVSPTLPWTEDIDGMTFFDTKLAGAQLGAKEQSDKLLVLRVLSFYIQALFL